MKISKQTHKMEKEVIKKKVVQVNGQRRYYSKLNGRHKQQTRLKLEQNPNYAQLKTLILVGNFK